MKISSRGLSMFLAGAVFVTFASLAGSNCSPSGGDVPGGGSGGEGGSGEGGEKGTGGKSGTGGKNGTGGSDEGSGGSDKGGNSGSGGSSKGGNTGSGGSSSGTGGSSSGTGGSSSGTGGSTTQPGTGGSGGGGTTSSGRKCAPTSASTPAITSTGGLACPSGLCTVGTYAGYLYVYSDGEKSGTSKICAAGDSLCASGSTGAQSDSTWGAAIGFNLDKSSTPVAVQLSGTGMKYELSALPTSGLRAQVSNGGDDYCVTLTAASGTVPWTDFATKCWGSTGVKLTGAPKTTKVEFQVTAATAAGTFDFCVKSVSF